MAEDELRRQQSLSRPSEKERKYDRQLRLWAASGQAALESANVLLVNSGSGTVGVETLKNLVLPGIGSFTIFDESLVEEADLGVNFFLDDTCIGKSRAQCCTELLLELNPEVRGDWFPKPKGDQSLPSFLAAAPPYTVILHTFPIQPSSLAAVEAYGSNFNVPLVAIHSAGLYSCFRIQLSQALPIVDTHPDEAAVIDLRLLSPWPELSSFAQEMTENIDSLDDHKHGHLPFIVILLHFLERWRATHEGKNPSSYAEKVAFRKLVAENARSNNPEGGEENFDEATAAVLRALVPPSLPSSLKQVFNYKEADPGKPFTSFWIIANAIKQFYEKHSALPLPGSMPDLKAESGVYIKLQNIFKAKAREDAAEVLRSVRAVPGGEAIGSAEVEEFCKNAAFVKLIIAADNDPNILNRTAREQFENDAIAELTLSPFSLLPIYLALRATAHTPSASSEDILEEMVKIVPDARESERLVKAAQEVSRAKGGELHNISAITGGLVAQEVIKITTRQYVPIDNTCIFDGIGSRCQVLRL